MTSLRKWALWTVLCGFVAVSSVIGACGDGGGDSGRVGGTTSDDDDEGDDDYTPPSDDDATDDDSTDDDSDDDSDDDTDDDTGDDDTSDDDVVDDDTTDDDTSDDDTSDDDTSDDDTGDDDTSGVTQCYVDAVAEQSGCATGAATPRDAAICVENVWRDAIVCVTNNGGSEAMQNCLDTCCDDLNACYMACDENDVGCNTACFSPLGDCIGTCAGR